MKKLKGNAAEIMKNIIHDEESVYEIDGKRYHLAVIEEPETTIQEDIESAPELEGKLRQAKKDISSGNVYSTDDVLKMIDQGDL
ncbi:hypothetical protein [Virgibacillus doumboii]|uniref:hypothetical protein n=1 Tax=Virgibacillus doumboii TaxID=2697503 RepID=UPI0013E0546B|nr:hypothetical protein [Virgibacillus doumboii]